MKNKIALSFLAVILGLFIYSCRKEFSSPDDLNPAAPTALSVKDARAYFKSSLKTKSTNSISGNKDGEMRPLWHKALTGSTGKSAFVEVPLQNPGLNFTLLAFDEHGTPVQGDKSIVKYVFKRLILYKNPKTGAIVPRVLTYIPDRSYLEKNKFDATGVRIKALKGFSGYIQVHTLENQPISVYKYINGSKVFKFRWYTRAETKNSSSPEIKTKGYEWVCTPTYCWQCVYVQDHPEYGETCTDPVECGQDCNSYWVPDPPTDPTDPTDPNQPGENENPGGGTTAPEALQVKSAVANKPFAFFDDVPCEVLKKWLETAKFVPGNDIIAKLNTLVSYGVMTGSNTPINSTVVARVQSINDAYSPVVNMDYFGVNVIEMPYIGDNRLTPDQFIHYIRTHLNELTDGTKTFNAYNAYGIDDRAKWASTNPTGSVLALDIAGPDNASVITSYSSSNKWTFTTIFEPMYGAHPVSGNRDFSYIAHENGSYTFYTRGVDRLTSWDGQFMQWAFGIPFAAADGLWTDFQGKLNAFVQNHGGTSIIEAPVIYRPDWNKVKDVIEGRQPLSTLSKDCPD